MTQPKVTNQTPVKTPVKWLDALFDWAAERDGRLTATRKIFRYPDVGDRPPKGE